MQRHEIVNKFPAIGASLEFTSPATPVYNCIAYAAGDTTRWWWPDALNFGYWPPGVQRAIRLPAFQSAFETLGYLLCENSGFEDGYEKVAIFSKSGTPSHAAIQLPSSGVWSSKLGQQVDVSHSLSGMEGGFYGEVAYCMKRELIISATASPQLS